MKPAAGFLEGVWCLSCCDRSAKAGPPFQLLEWLYGKLPDACGNYLRLSFNQKVDGSIPWGLTRYNQLPSRIQ
jgi:hypothetical protein